MATICQLTIPELDLLADSRIRLHRVLDSESDTPALHGGWRQGGY
jgi:hypothetical protein